MDKIRSVVQDREDESGGNETGNEDADESEFKKYIANEHSLFETAR